MEDGRWSEGGAKAEAIEIVPTGRLTTAWDRVPGFEVFHQFASLGRKRRIIGSLPAVRFLG
mgnify:CR=1 FL=1